jgi:hypothetical protein
MLFFAQTRSNGVERLTPRTNIRFSCSQPPDTTRAQYPIGVGGYSQFPYVAKPTHSKTASRHFAAVPVSITDTVVSMASLIIEAIKDIHLSIFPELDHACTLKIIVRDNVGVIIPPADKSLSIYFPHTLTTYSQEFTSRGLCPVVELIVREHKTKKLAPGEYSVMVVVSPEFPRKPGVLNQAGPK